MDKSQTDRSITLYDDGTRSPTFALKQTNDVSQCSFVLFFPVSSLVGQALLSARRGAVPTADVQSRWHAGSVARQHRLPWRALCPSPPYSTRPTSSGSIFSTRPIRGK